MRYIIIKKYIKKIIIWLNLDILINNSKFILCGISISSLLIISLFFYLNFIKKEIILSYDDLVYYSIVNTTVFAITLYLYSIIFVIFKGAKGELTKRQLIYQHLGQAIIFGFFLIFEIFLILLVFDLFTYVGLKIIKGKCP
jgi:hypothetical protein